MKDRNFDPLVERFERRVYGGLKGAIRLAVLRRDLRRELAAAHSLDVLDIGAGLGQLSLELAGQGHRVVYNELSERMLHRAQASAADAGLLDAIQWSPGPCQGLLEKRGQQYDLILCHALIEWLEHPEVLMPLLRESLRDGGLLSLCFYNPAGKTYRNLIRGNFDWLQQADAYESDEGSLTPNNPPALEQVCCWCEQAGLELIGRSGIRVFHDYVVEQRGGHQHEAQVIDMELRYSQHDQLWQLGRYLHLLLRPARATV